MDQNQQTTLDRIASTVEEISKSMQLLVVVMEDIQILLRNESRRVDDHHISDEPDAVKEDESVSVPVLDKKGGQKDHLTIFYSAILEGFKKLPYGPFSMKDVTIFDAKERPVAPYDLTGVMSRYQEFKKFDIVSDYSSHMFSANVATHVPTPTDWNMVMTKELDSLKKLLPGNIFVRTYERRPDLLTAVIIGPKGTPYQDGLYFFDVCFSATYPHSPPLVRYHSADLKIHPNLEADASVCLRLPGRINGVLVHEVQWSPNKSTMLDFLSFLKSLFNANPLLNAVEYCDPNMFEGIHLLFYNEVVFVKSVRTMVAVMNNPPKHFEDFVVGHFRIHAADIMEACKAYLKGVQVGCVVNGLPTEGHKGTASNTFKEDLALCLKLLVDEFKKIGANVDEVLL